MINAKVLLTIAALLGAVLGVEVWQKNRAIDIDSRVKVDHAAALEKYAAERKRMEKQLRISDAISDYRAK